MSIVATEPCRWTTIPFARMKPAPYNPREISDAALAALGDSLDRYGLVQPIVWNERTGHIVGGHARVRALQQRGDTEADACVVDLSEEEEKRLSVALNNPALQGGFNWKALSDLLKELKAKSSRDDYERSGLATLAAQLPLFNGLKETQHPEEEKKRFTPTEAERLNLRPADIKMLQLFFTGEQHRAVMNWFAELAAALGTGNPSDSILRLAVLGFLPESPAGGRLKCKNRFSHLAPEGAKPAAEDDYGQARS